MRGRSVAGMLKLVRSVVSVLVRRFRSRAVLELENLALRHQLHVLRRQRPGRPRLFAIDRLLWVWLYRLWPRCLDVMVLVKPATVIQWHRQGFRRYWRWRSRSGRPSVDREVRKLIRQMSTANPLWGAPRIHGELLKLGIEVSQATVAKYMVRRRGTPSPTWRSFLRNQAAWYRRHRHVCCCVRIVSAALRDDHSGPRSQEYPTHGRHRASHRSLALPPGNRSVSVGHCSALSASRSRCVVRLGILQPDRGNGDQGSHHRATLALAERIRRARDRFDSPRVS